MKTLWSILLAGAASLAMRAGVSAAETPEDATARIDFIKKQLVEAGWSSDQAAVILEQGPRWFPGQSADQIWRQRTTEQKSLVVVHADGGIELHGRVLSRDNFRVRMKGLAQTNPDYTVVLRGDENTPFQRIAEVLAVCQGAGVRNFALPASKSE